jgi:arylsulfatase B
MHNSDLFPTLLKLAGVKLDQKLKLDGVDQWNVINYGGYPARSEIVNIDDVLGFGSYIYNTYKLVNGTILNGIYDGWLGSKSNDGDDSLNYALKVLNSTVSRALLSIPKHFKLSIERIFELRFSASVQCSNSVEKNPCDPRIRPCVFNIIADPCEENNLAETRPGLLNSMLNRYNAYRKQVPSRRKSPDPACDPINFNKTWNWWQSDSPQ